MKSLGTFERHENFPSRFVIRRHVDVWCPPGYLDEAPYPVIYMHDGQNIFDDALAFHDDIVARNAGIGGRCVFVAEIHIHGISHEQIAFTQAA